MWGSDPLVVRSTRRDLANYEPVPGDQVVCREGHWQHAGTYIVTRTLVDMGQETIQSVRFRRAHEPELMSVDCSLPAGACPHTSEAVNYWVYDRDITGVLPQKTFSVGDHVGLVDGDLVLGRVVATNAAYGLIEVNNAYGDCFILDAVNCEKKNA